MMEVGAKAKVAQKAAGNGGNRRPPHQQLGARQSMPFYLELNGVAIVPRLGEIYVYSLDSNISKRIDDSAI